ncbi:S41 family peptidase [Nibribacter koreensis]|uniref:S41 family peptidase n=1 Tax=Nibribacter koreensis TaxID=1084519 RepID=A0ABP8FP28_9BACT
MGYLRSSLEETHFNLYAYTSKPEFEKNYKRIINSLTTDSLTLLQATNLFQKVVTKAQTGHCEIDFPAYSYILYAQNGGTVFPLEIALENGKAYVRKNFSGNKAIQIGTQVTSMNGQKVDKILAQLYPHISAERLYFKNAKLEFWSLPRLYWQVFGEQDSFEVAFLHGGKTTAHTLSAISIMDYENNRQGEILRSARSFKFLGNTAYLHPGAFSGDPATGEASFKHFVDSAFAAIRHQKADVLVIDLRNNAGGHNAYSDYLISHIATKPFKWNSSFQLKPSTLLKDQIRLQKDTSDNYSQAILTHATGQVFDYATESYLPAIDDKRFKGKVYVLINRQTYSMAAVTAALVQDYQFAILVGEETGDLPTLYASQFSFNLPATSVQVKVPKGYMVRPNKSQALKGVQPDIVIKDHLLDEEDEILNGLLSRITPSNK